MTTTRLFLALWPAPEVQAALGSFQLQTKWASGTRTEPRLHLHLTLHFIGQVEHERTPEILAAIYVPSPQVRLSLDRAELWNHTTAVLTASATPPELADFRAELGKCLTRLDLPVDERDFRPHVTLAKNAGPTWKPPAGTIEWISSGYALVESAEGRYHILRNYP